jgi:hypothetical protein
VPPDHLPFVSGEQWQVRSAKNGSLTMTASPGDPNIAQEESSRSLDIGRKGRSLQYCTHFVTHGRQPTGKQTWFNAVQRDTACCCSVDSLPDETYI